jgi:Zn-dependent peptidase ImmA (M78 family)
MLGRYSFSIAHEIGHWRLHQSYAAEPTVMCRSSQKTEPIEWQANYFASCLLMPRRHVLEVWTSFLNGDGSTDPLLLVALPNGTIVKHSQAMIYAKECELALDHDYVCSVIARPIADRFGVSAQAMRIRLEELQLLPAK